MTNVFFCKYGSFFNFLYFLKVSTHLCLICIYRLFSSHKIVEWNNTKRFWMKQNKGFVLSTRSFKLNHMCHPFHESSHKMSWIEYCILCLLQMMDVFLCLLQYMRCMQIFFNWLEWLEWTLSTCGEIRMWFISFCLSNSKYIWMTCGH